MGNVGKQLFFGPKSCPNITSPICNSTKPNVWKHILLSCTQHHIHVLQVKTHNKENTISMLYRLKHIIKPVEIA
jgi:hypothetical protein